MYYGNLISTTISKNKIDEITAAIERINDQLPTLITLSKEEMSSMPKVSYQNIDFIHEVLEFVDTYPEMVLHGANLNGHPLYGELVSKSEKLALVRFKTKDYNYTIEIPLKYVIL